MLNLFQRIYSSDNIAVLQPFFGHTEPLGYYMQVCMFDRISRHASAGQRSVLKNGYTAIENTFHFLRNPIQQILILPDKSSVRNFPTPSPAKCFAFHSCFRYASGHCLPCFHPFRTGVSAVVIPDAPSAIHPRNRLPQSTRDRVSQSLPHEHLPGHPLSESGITRRFHQIPGAVPCPATGLRFHPAYPVTRLRIRYPAKKFSCCNPPRRISIHLQKFFATD